MKRTFALFGCLLASYANAGAVARSTSALPEFGPPPHGEAQWVARSMRHNGLPMTLQSFHSRLSAAEVLQHYKSQAEHDLSHESVRSWRGEWQVLAIRGERYFVTIQAHDSAPGSVGTIAVTPNPASIATSLATRFPLTSSMRIVNLQQYEDRGDESEHISLISSRAPHLEASSCAQLLSREGWQLVQDAPARKIEHGHVIEAQKGAAHARLTFMPDRTGEGRTAIIIVWRRSS
jgi:hypothetical protein